MAKLKKKLKERQSKSAKPQEPLFDISQETRNSIWGVLSLSISLVSALSFFGLAGAAGDFFNSGARALFGWGFFIVPVAFLMLGVAFIKSLSRKIYFSAVFGTSLFVLSILAMFFSFGSGAFNERIIQGGYLGVVLGYPLLNSVGFVATMIILASVLFISFLVTLNVPVYRLMNKEEKESKDKVVDKLVVKRGNEIIDDKLKSSSAPAPAAPLAKTIKADERGDFIIKNSRRGKWSLPPLDLLNKDSEEAETGDINASANVIKRTLGNFGIDVEMGEVSIGPTVTQFTMRPAVGVKLSRIVGLNNDLSLALASHPIRIEAPIPGKSLVGIEVPNRKFAVVGLRDMLESDEFKKSKQIFPLAMGRDVSGAPLFAALEKMPHLLVAGATGTGKSVTINSILLSMLYRHTPDVLKMILVDPKRVELTLYNDIPHLITPVITDNKKVLGALKWAVNEMDRRYDTLSKHGSRDISAYNTSISEKGEPIMPYLIIVIDEMADLMSSYGRDVEAAIVRLAQMSRAVGIHLILSTQRPSVEVITGLIKANITTRVALQVASQIDSRTILDMAGAEKLLGRGDMLFISNDSAKGRRLQGAFVTEKEVKDVVKFWRQQGQEVADEEKEEMVIDFNTQGGSVANGRFGGEDDGGDDLYFQAKDTVIQTQKASASFLQRRLGVGYARAARLLDILETNGIIGPGQGAKPRDVYIKSDGSRIENNAVLIGETGMSADSPEAEKDEA